MFTEGESELRAAQTHSDSYANTEKNKPSLENWKSQITCVLTQDKYHF